MRSKKQGRLTFYEMKKGSISWNINYKVNDRWFVKGTVLNEHQRCVAVYKNNYAVLYYYTALVYCYM